MVDETVIEEVVIDNEVEVPVVDDVNPQPGMMNVEDTMNNPTVFNRNEFSFDEEEGLEEDDEYDPNRLKLEKLDLTPEQLELIVPSIDRFRDLGMTNKQIEAVVEEIMDEPETEEEKVNNLKDNLTREEKKNYSRINSFVNEIFSDEKDIDESLLSEVMLDPMAIKLLNVFYKKSTGRRQISNGSIATPMTKDNTDEIESEQLNILRKASMTPEERRNAMRKLYNKSTNKAWAKKEFKEYL